MYKVAYQRYTNIAIIFRQYVLAVMQLLIINKINGMFLLQSITCVMMLLVIGKEMQTLLSITYLLLFLPRVKEVLNVIHILQELLLLIVPIKQTPSALELMLQRS